MFTCGAVIRGKQKKDQRNLEQAMYYWAETDSPVDLSAAAPQPVTQSVATVAPQKAGIDPIKNKKAGRIMWIAGLVLLIGGALIALFRDLMWFFFGSVLFGIVFIVSGIIRCVRASHASKAAPSIVGAPQLGVLSRPATSSALVPEEDKRQQVRRPASASGCYSFRVAGIKYRMDAVRSVATRNPAFYMDPCDYDGLVQSRNYEYLMELPDPMLVEEPENQYDENAVGVIIKDQHVGYVPADETGAVRPLISRAKRMSAQLAGGRWRSENSAGETNMYITVNVYY